MKWITDPDSSPEICPDCGNSFPCVPREGKIGYKCPKCGFELVNTWGNSVCEKSSFDKCSRCKKFKDCFVIRDDVYYELMTRETMDIELSQMELRRKVTSGEIPPVEPQIDAHCDLCEHQGRCRKRWERLEWQYRDSSHDFELGKVCVKFTLNVTEIKRSYYDWHRYIIAGRRIKSFSPVPVYPFLIGMDW